MEVASRVLSFTRKAAKEELIASFATFAPLERRSGDRGQSLKKARSAASCGESQSQKLMLQKLQLRLLLVRTNTPLHFGVEPSRVGVVIVPLCW